MPGTAPELVHAGLCTEHCAYTTHVCCPQLPTVDCSAYEGRGGTCTFHCCLTAAAGNYAAGLILLSVFWDCMTLLRGGIKILMLLVMIRCQYSIMIMSAEKSWNQPKVDFLVQGAQVFIILN